MKLFEESCENRFSDNVKKLVKIIIILASLLYLVYFIIIIVCLDYHRKYITNFINKINFGLTNNKNDYKWNVAVLIHSLFGGIYAILIFVFNEEFEFKNSNYNNDSSSRIRRRNFSDIVIQYNNNNENNERQIGELKDTIRNLNTKISNLERKNNYLTKERDNFRRNKVKLTKINNNLNKTVGQNEKDSVEELKKIIKEKDEKIALLEGNNKLLLETNNKYKNIVNALKSSIPFELSGNEKLISIIFQSANQEINYPIICKTNQKFNEVENLLYDKFPKYKKSENYFLLGGAKINRSLTIDENKIKNGDIIIMNIFDDSML